MSLIRRFGADPLALAGRTLKGITDSTGAQVQIPSRDSTEDADVPESEDSQDGPLVTVTISGDSTAVSEARAKIMAIVSERASKVTKQLESIPKEFWPLLNGAKGAKINELIEAAGATGSVSVFIPRSYEKRGVSASGEVEEDREAAEKFVTVNGEREALAKVVQAIEAEVANLVSSCSECELSRADLPYLCRSATLPPLPSASTSASTASSSAPLEMRFSRRQAAPSRFLLSTMPTRTLPSAVPRRPSSALSKSCAEQSPLCRYKLTSLLAGHEQGQRYSH